MTNALAVVPDVQGEEWYQALVEECKAIITEAVFTSRWALVEGYHALGERIVKDSGYKRWEQKKAGSVLSHVIKDLGISQASRICNGLIGDARRIYNSVKERHP